MTVDSAESFRWRLSLRPDPSLGLPSIDSFNRWAVEPFGLAREGDQLRGLERSENRPQAVLAFPLMASCATPRLRSFVVLIGEPAGEGVALYRRSKPASFDSPCDSLTKPGLLGVCVALTSTFQGQLFHRRIASPGSYAPTVQCPPIRALEVRAPALSLIPLSRLRGALRGAPLP